MGFMDINDALNDPGLRAVRRKDNEFILPVAHPACWHNSLRDRSTGSVGVAEETNAEFNLPPTTMEHSELPVESSSFQRSNALDLGADSPAVTPMPPEFELMHDRCVRSSEWVEQANGKMAHFIGYRCLTPEDEARYRLSDPENGLHHDDLKAFRASIRGPVKRGPVARFFARLKFWSSEVP